MPNYNSNSSYKYNKNIPNDSQEFSESKAINDSAPADDTSNLSFSGHSSSSSSTAYGEDITNTPSDNHNYRRPSSIFNFNRGNILSGIIFSEILGEPLAKRNMRKK